MNSPHVEEELTKPAVSSILYEQLAASTHPETLFPPERWNDLVNSILPEHLPRRIASLASSFGLPWPSKSKWQDLTVAQCCTSSVDELLDLPTMGRKKLRTILLILAYLVDNPEHGDQQVFSECGQLPSYTTLASAEMPWLHISDDQWRVMCDLIPPELQTTRIKTIAHDLGLKWPAKKNWDDVCVKNYLSHSLNQLSKIPQLGRVKRRSVFLAIAYLATSDQENPSDIEKELDIWDHPVLQKLTERERAVFDQRILQPTGKETLESLGEHYNLTRERIRQIEKLIIKRIKSSSLASTLSTILLAYEKTVFLPRHVEEPFLLVEALDDFLHLLPKEVALAISVRFKTIPLWLSSFTLETGCGWFLGSQEEWNAIAEAVGRLGDDLPSLKCERLASMTGVSRAAFIAHALLTKSGSIVHGYFIPSKAGRAHAKRATILCEAALNADRVFWSHLELIQHAVGSVDRYSFRSFRLSMSNNSRLFLTTPGYVACLRHEQVPSQGGALGEVVEDYPSGEEEEDGTPRGVLRDVLLEEWPITGTNISQIFRRRAPDAGTSDNSLLPILSSDPLTCRLAPGIYAPVDCDNSSPRFERARRLALDDKDLRSYCFVKRSGESPTGFFPLWDGEQEQRWYRKLRKREDCPLLSTLAFVATQEQWPEQSPKETLELLDLKISARFLITPSWIAARSYRSPSVGEALTTLRYAYDIGPLSWIRANQILCSSQMMDEAGITTVILGIALGLLDDAKRPWWEPVPASANFIEIWNGLEKLHLHEELPSWKHPFILEKLHLSLEKAEANSLAFVTSPTLINIFQGFGFKC